MADPRLHRQLSLIPYSPERGQIVLRHGSSVVVRDPQSRQLILRERDEDDVIDRGTCPYCHRPYDHDADEALRQPRDPSPPMTNNARFVSTDYFHMLAESSGLAPNRPPRALRSAGSRNATPSGPPTQQSEDQNAPLNHAEDQIDHDSLLQGYFKRFFIELRTLGKGGFGIVLLVEHVLNGVHLGEFACKRIPVGNDRIWLRKVLGEVQLLQRLNHKNLVSYRHVWLEDVQTSRFSPSVPHVFILQSFCNGGDLQQYVQHFGGKTGSVVSPNRRPSFSRSRSSALPLDSVLAFFSDITSGLHYLHSNNYIHRDLKPSNCLLHNENGRLTVLVSDFGEVQMAGVRRASTGSTGTISYCAPEVLRLVSEDGTYGNFTIKSDVFSLGMILYFMCFGDLPYSNADADEEKEDSDALRAEISEWQGLEDIIKKRKDLPVKFFTFLSRLLDTDPDRRPTTGEILATAYSAEDVDTNSHVHRSARPSFSVDVNASRGLAINPKSSPRLDDPAMSSQSPDEYIPGISDSTAHRRRASDRTISARDMTTRRFSQPMERPEDSTVTRGRSPGYLDEDGSVLTDGSESPSSHPRHETKIHPLALPAPEPPHIKPYNPRAVMGTFGLLRILLFFIKVLSLTYPCLPYAASPKLTYPLFCLAALDLGLDLGRLASIATFVAHFGTLVLMNGRGQLCASPTHMKGYVFPDAQR